jgi:hypothetical protein
VIIVGDMKLTNPMHDVSGPPGVDTATPGEVAAALGTSEGGLAQMRFRGTGPNYIRIGGAKRGRILYRWSDVRAYLDAKTIQPTDPAGTAPDGAA